ncbi:hypothetical protein ACIBVL_41265 [Streptomyces sp. NPDC049687]|uniref:hypothetical protein n=1 Tax=Streptomyces sp. NPDC049687 TaxID=3365596 RepID=UPI0037B4038A
MSRTTGAAHGVIVLDLRSGAHTLATPGALRAAVHEQLRTEGLPEPGNGHYRFLLLDTPRGLMDHHSLYEKILGYGSKAWMLGLVVGDLPDAEDARTDHGDENGGRPAGAPDATGAYRCRLVRPAALHGPDAGLLWVGDLRAARTAGDAVRPDDPEALAVLVDLLRGLFDETLEALARFPDAVAVPGVHVLEHDLSGAARERAWREALTRFAGERYTGAQRTGDDDTSRIELPKPVDELAAGRPAGPVPGHRTPGGAADRAYTGCSSALDDAHAGWARLSGAGGLLRGAGRRAAEAALDAASHGLSGYRTLVLKALHEGAPGATAAASESTLLLTELGIRVPTYSGSREAVGEGLQRLAERMLGERLALRSVAERFAALSEQVAPAPSAGLLTEADRRCPPELPPRVSAEQHFGAAAITFGQLAGAAAAGGLATLYPWPGTLAVLAVLAVLIGGSLLAQAHRPGHAHSGSVLAGVAAQGVAAATGATGGHLLTRAWPVPSWAALLGALCGLGLALVLVLVRWRRAVDAWWELTGADDARRALDGLDALLAEAVFRQRWAAEERLYCADAARMVAGVLRGAAVSAEELDGRPEESERATATAGGWEEHDRETVAPGPAADLPGVHDRPDWMPAPDPYSRTSSADQPERGPAPAGTHPNTASAGGQAPRADALLGDGPRWLDREAGEGGPHLVDTLVEDLTDTLVHALGLYWGVVARGQAGAGALTDVEQRIRQMFEVTRRHLFTQGVVSPPPFARSADRRGSAEGLLGIGHQRVADAIEPDPQGRRMVDLASEHQAPLLSRDPNTVEWIRFAPQAVWKGSNGHAGAGAEARDFRQAPVAVSESVHSRSVWTPTGRYAGLLKLVPLRLGVVTSVRLREWAEERPAARDRLWYEEGL